MKPRNNLLTFIFAASFLLSNAAFALSSDQKQPINIEANTQHVDMKRNIVVFKGNVVLTQGSIRLTARELTVQRDAKTNQLKSMESIGSPARFSQKSDTGQLMKGQANNLLYLVPEDKIVLTKNAELYQDDSVIKGEKITYQISSQNLEAQSGSSGRVTTTIIPSQIK